jgi:fimbrial isopeptide formation D2 family protein/LPXTG-motif cell wall-anchored protein
MSKLKRMLSLALATAMTLCSGVFTTMAKAEDSYKICIQNATDGHTYVAYQILTGTVEGNTLNDIKWGSDVVEHDTEITSGDTDVATNHSCAYENSATDFAEALSGKSDYEALELVEDELSALASGTNSGSYDADSKEYEISVSAPGYYLVKDIYAEGVDAYSSYILAVVDAETDVVVKGEVPSVTKSVYDEDEYMAALLTGAGVSGLVSTGGYGDTADYDIGDEVPFRLDATLPSNYDKYSEYNLIFHDTLTHLTYKQLDKVLYIDKEGNETDISELVDEVDANYDEATKELTIAVGDLKSADVVKYEGTIRVEYTATLDEDANIGATGNPNVVYLEYSNNPNYDVNNDDNNDGQDNKGENNSTGTTPEDEVIVYTYEICINKVDGKGNALSGAEFTLYKLEVDEDGDGFDKVAVTGTVSDGTKFQFKGLDAGYYMLEETTPPEDYNAVAPMVFAITAEHYVENGTYVLVLDSDSAEDGDAILSKINNTTIDSVTPIEFSVTEDDNMCLEANVVNNKGVTLPTTGGMGTKAIYVIGGLMVLAAGVLLITKRRMGNE